MRLFDVTTEPEWVATNELRWRSFNKPWWRLTGKSELPLVLEQKWMSDAGQIEWREPPTVPEGA